MPVLAELRSFFRFLLRRGAVERQMDEEIQTHIALRAEQLVGRGVPPADAERQARSEVGSAGALKEDMRHAVPAAMSIDTWAKDVGYALRRMRHAPGFTALAAATLALGIGGTSAIFTVVKTVLLDPPPYQEPERLVLLWTTNSTQGTARGPSSGPQLAEVRRRAQSFTGIGGIWAGGGTFTGDGEPEQVKVGVVTGSFFPVLGARPLLGRTLEPDDEGSGKPATVLLAYGLWQRRFGGDPNIVGRVVRLDGAPARVVGVMPPAFRMVFPAEAQVPDTIQAWKPFDTDVPGLPRDLFLLRFVARLRPGVTVAQADQEITAIGEKLKADVLAGNRDGFDGMRAVAMHGDAVQEIRPALDALFAGVGLVLLIACVNVANLLLARGDGRRRELAVRAALGASRWRLARQLLLENMVLAAAGGVLGLVLGGLALDRLAALAPAGVLPPVPLTLDRGVFVFAAAVTGLAGMIFGIAPALSGSRVHLSEAMKGGAGATERRRRSRAVLVVCEVALGFVLLVGAGLMIRTFVAVNAVDPGLRAAGTLSFEVNLPTQRYPDSETRARFARTLEERLRAVAGVEDVGATTHLPFDDFPNWYNTCRPVGVVDSRPEGIQADHRGATPGYLRAIGATLVRGRFYDALDDAAGRAVVVVDERLANEAWPNADPIGQRIEHEYHHDGQYGALTSEVVGVVRHVRQQRLTGTPRGQIYMPYRAATRDHLSFVLRTAGDPSAFAGPARSAVQTLDAELAVGKVRPLGDYLDGALRPARFTMVLASLFGALALALAAVGIYGVVATTVAHRRRELGVRLALGATPGRLVRQLVREELVPAAIGLAIGAAGAVAVSRLLRALVFGVSAIDPVTFVAAALILPAAAVLASWLPARQAARTNPMSALKLQ